MLISWRPGRIRASGRRGSVSPATRIVAVCPWTSQSPGTSDEMSWQTSLTPKAGRYWYQEIRREVAEVGTQVGDELRSRFKSLFWDLLATCLRLASVVLRRRWRLVTCASAQSVTREYFISFAVRSAGRAWLRESSYCKSRLRKHPTYLFLLLFSWLVINWAECKPTQVQKNKSLAADSVLELGAHTGKTDGRTTDRVNVKCGIVGEETT